LDRGGLRCSATLGLYELTNGRTNWFTIEWIDRSVPFDAFTQVIANFQMTCHGPQRDPMPRTAYRLPIMLLLVGLVLVAAVAEPATAEDDLPGSRRNDNRWTPSLALSIGFTSQRFEGSVESERSLFAFFFFQDVRPTDRSQKYLNMPNVSGMLEVQSPALPIPYLRPRIFFGGHADSVSSQRRSIAREGDPQSELTVPEGTGPFTELELLGTGSETTIDSETIQFGAHVGIAFPVQVGDWQVSVKPSVRYLRQELLFTGIVSEGNRGDGMETVARSIPTNRILLEGSASTDLHAVGPGLEIEIEAGGVRSLSASVFVSGGAYRVLSDLQIPFSAQGMDSNQTGFTLYNANWTADIDPWLYRANVGMRIRWTGANPGWLLGRDPAGAVFAGLARVLP
jgi:hypothetical protein